MKIRLKLHLATLISLFSIQSFAQVEIDRVYLEPAPATLNGAFVLKSSFPVVMVLANGEKEVRKYHVKVMTRSRGVGASSADFSTSGGEDLIKIKNQSGMEELTVTDLLQEYWGKQFTHVIPSILAGPIGSDDFSAINSKKLSLEYSRSASGGIGGLAWASSRIQIIPDPEFQEVTSDWNEKLIWKKNGSYEGATKPVPLRFIKSSSPAGFVSIEYRDTLRDAVATFTQIVPFLKGGIVEWPRSTLVLVDAESSINRLVFVNHDHEKNGETVRIELDLSRRITNGSGYFHPQSVMGRYKIRLKDGQNIAEESIKFYLPEPFVINDLISP